MVTPPDFRRVFESAPFASLLLTPELHIVAATDGYLRVRNVRREIVLGRHLPDVVADVLLRESLERVLATREADTVETQSDGERHYSATSTPLLTESGDIAFIVHSVEEITALVRLTRRQRELEEAWTAAEAASRTKDEFISVISHELRTPLNVVQGWLWQLKRRGDDTSLREKAIDVIERNVAIQARLVDDLLDTSKAIVGKLRLRRRPVDLAAICRSTIDAHLRPAHDKGLTLTFTAPQQPVFVSGDADRLQQTVSNVLSNAIKFTPAGGTVEVIIRRVGVRARIEVRDTGVGIPPEFLGAVFEPFSQADKTSTREFGGLGLGLAIVKQIVTLHGGTVTATSGGDNQGTTVTIDFPIPAVLDDTAETERPGGAPPPAATDLGGVKVLVVDDEADARDAMRTILEHHGATVETAESATEALRLVSELQPDVLLTDLAMPDTDGYQLLRMVRDLPSGHELPALALTAHVGVGELALDAGFQEYTSKPVAPAQLISLVASLASGARH